MNGTVNARQVLLNRWSLQLAATAGVVAFALGRVDLGASLSAIRDADYAWAALALTMLTASRLLAAVRWRLYLSKIGRPPLLGLMGAWVVGSMVNILLPFRAGDFTKIQIVAGRYHLPRAAISSSVFTVEVVLDAVTLLVLFLTSLLILDVQVVPDALVFTFIALAGGGFVAAILTSRFMPREMPSWWLIRRLSPRASLILAEAWPRFLDGMFALRDRRLLARALSLHMLEWLMRSAVFWLLGFSFALDQGPITFVLLTIIVSLATLFPVTFLNFGTFQVVVTEVLVASGTPRADAFGYAVAAHAITHAWIMVMGMTALVLMQVNHDRTGDLERPLAEAPKDAGE